MGKFILTKRGQMWSMDLVIAIIIFFVGIVFLYMYAVNISEKSQETMDSLNYDGNTISNFILSEGYPENWNKTNFSIPGILTNGKINQTKLDSFYTISQENYTGIRNNFNTYYDFYFYFPNSTMMINGVERDGIGNPNINRNTISTVYNPDNLIRITRFTIYNNKVVKFYLYIWE
jgi:hypothetical protein